MMSRRDQGLRLVDEGAEHLGLDDVPELEETPLPKVIHGREEHALQTRHVRGGLVDPRELQQYPIVLGAFTADSSDEVPRAQHQLGGAHPVGKLLLCIEQERIAERDEPLEIPEDNLADGQRIAHSGPILFPWGRMTSGISGALPPGPALLRNYARNHGNQGPPHSHLTVCLLCIHRLLASEPGRASLSAAAGGWLSAFGCRRETVVAAPKPA